jgi:hypothetical protein
MMELSYFQTTNDQGEIVKLPRPEQKTLIDIDRVIALNKPWAVIDKFIALMIANNQWDWLDNHNQFIVDLEQTHEFNANLPVIGISEGDENGENGIEILAETKPLPLAPVRPPLITVEQFKANNPAVFAAHNKASGIVINGQQISLNERNQNGIASVLTGLSLADDVGADMFPLNFSAESPRGNSVFVFADLPQFKQFALQFMAARQAFFN